MALKYSFSKLFSGRFPRQKQLYETLEDIDERIDKGADAKPIVKSNIKLNKTSLKKAFGDPKKFDSIGIVNNDEGSYIVVASANEFKIITLENI